MSDSPRRDPIGVPFAVTSGPPRSWRFSLIWVVPLIAALTGAWVAVRAYVDKGPAITIEFNDAEGIEPGKTKVRYKSVDVGLVRQIAFAPDHRSVRVTVDL